MSKYNYYKVTCFSAHSGNGSKPVEVRYIKTKMSTYLVYINAGHQIRGINKVLNVSIITKEEYLEHKKAGDPSFHPKKKN